MRGGREQKTRVGLIFEAGVVVVFKLGTDGEMQGVRQEMEFVLQKRAVDLVGAVVRPKIGEGRGLEIGAGAEADFAAVGEQIVGVERDAMEEIDVNLIANFAEIRSFAVIARPVGLEVEI